MRWREREKGIPQSTDGSQGDFTIVQKSKSFWHNVGSFYLLIFSDSFEESPCIKDKIEGNLRKTHGTEVLICAAAGGSLLWSTFGVAPTSAFSTFTRDGSTGSSSSKKTIRRRGISPLLRSPLQASFASRMGPLVAEPSASRSRSLRASIVAPEETKEDAGTISDGVDLKSEFLQRMQWRGFLAQATDLEGIDAKLAEGTVVAYLGFDATAPSLHVGSLLQIMLLRHFQQCGHKPIVLVGGGTTKVGDPTGKDESRQMLTDATIAENIAGISSVFEKFLKFGDGPTDAVIVNNDDWLSGLRYLEFLRDYGKHFTINRMLSFESVKQRLSRESPFSFLEFNYMILQGYDFLELSRRYDAALQFGGSDQWGNIINGVELGRRVSCAPES